MSSRSILVFVQPSRRELLLELSIRYRIQSMSTVSSLTVIIQVKGNGASGSFRLGEKKTAEKKKATKSVKKPVAKKSTTASPKKTKKTSKVR